MSENMRLHWSVQDKLRPLDNAVKLESLSFDPIPNNETVVGQVRLRINQSGTEFIEHIHKGVLELRWPSDSDNPFDNLPICRFSIERVTEVSFHRPNDPERPFTNEATVFVQAKVNVHWHLFLQPDLIHS